MNSGTSPPHNLRRGILLMLASIGFFCCMDLTSKLLTARYPVVEIVAIRNAVQVVLMLAIFGPKWGLDLVRSRRPGLQFVRGAAISVASLAFVTALSLMPIAEVSAISFTSPLLIALISAIWLGERSSHAARMAVVTGFIGVLIIMRPGAGIFTWVALLPLLAAVFTATYQVLTRKLSVIDHSLALLFYPSLLAAIVFGCLTPLVWVTPQWKDIPLLLAIGMLGTVGHFLMIRAYRQAPASQLAPFTYVQLVIMIFLGYLVFDQFPDHWSLLGMLIIVASGLYIITRQGGLRRP